MSMTTRNIAKLPDWTRVVGPLSLKKKKPRWGRGFSGFLRGDGTDDGREISTGAPIILSRAAQSPLCFPKACSRKDDTFEDN